MSITQAQTVRVTAMGGIRYIIAEYRTLCKGSQIYIIVNIINNIGDSANIIVVSLFSMWPAPFLIVVVYVAYAEHVVIAVYGHVKILV